MLGVREEVRLHLEPKRVHHVHIMRNDEDRRALIRSLCPASNPFVLGLARPTVPNLPAAPRNPDMRRLDHRANLRMCWLARPVVMC